MCQPFNGLHAVELSLKLRTNQRIVRFTGTQCAILLLVFVSILVLVLARALLLLPVLIRGQCRAVLLTQVTTVDNLRAGGRG